MDLELSLGLPTDQYASKSYEKRRHFKEPCARSSKCLQSSPLLVWSGQPNEDGDWNGPEDKMSSNSTNKTEDENHIVGWPPIKTSRKMTSRNNQVGCLIHQDRRLLQVEENGNKGNASNSMYVKVKMEGVAISRMIDLMRYDCYYTLTNALISMFVKYRKFDVKACTTYLLAYQDRRGDWLFAGDVPWQCFIESVKRLELINGQG